MKILLTGGGGAIGNQLIPILLEFGHTIVSISRREIPLNHPNLKKIYININDIEIEKDLLLYPQSSEKQTILNSELNDIQSTIHLAGIASGEGKNWRDYELGNIITTQKIVKICELKNIDKIIYASSISVYGSLNTTPNVETDPLNGITFYAKSKIEAENIILRSLIHKKIILRISSVYGKNLKSFINKIIKLNEKGIIPFPLIKNNFKSFIYIDDLINFIINCLSFDIEGTFNISHPRLVEYRELIKTIEIIQKRKSIKIPLHSLMVPLEKFINKVFMNREESTLRPLFFSSTVNSNEAITKLKYIPKYDIDSGISKILG